MRTRYQSRRSSVKNSTPVNLPGRQTGHACDEVILTAAFLGVVVAFVYALCSGGLCSFQSIRENLRATQVVMQKAEALRLVTGCQAPDTQKAIDPLVVGPSDRRDRGSNSPDAPRADSGTVTVTAYWTNCGSGTPVVQSRQIQTRLARNGAPKYIWGAQ